MNTSLSHSIKGSPERSRLKPMTVKFDNYTVDTIDDLRAVCVKKLMDLEKGLYEEKQKLQDFLDNTPENTEQHLFDLLKRSREKLISVIDQYYTQCQENIRKRTSPELFNTLHESAVKLTTLISEQLNEVSQLESELNSPTRWWEGINNAMKLDPNSHLDGLRQHVKHLESSASENLPRITVNDQFLYSIGMEVKKYITIFPKTAADVSQTLDRSSHRLPNLTASQFDTIGSFHTTDKKRLSSEKRIFEESPEPARELPVAENPILTNFPPPNSRPSSHSKKPHLPSNSRKTQGRAHGSAQPPGRFTVSEQPRKSKREDDVDLDRTQEEEGYLRDSFRPSKFAESLRAQSETKQRQKSEARGIPAVDIVDYFNQNCDRRYLHFFQDNSKKLHIYDLLSLQSSQKLEHHEIDLEISFKVPIWHRSIITPQGDIYLTGGSDAVRSNMNLSSVYLFNYETYGLDELAPMTAARNSHGICYFQGCIVVVGGCVDNDGYSAKCEALDVTTNRNRASQQWRQLPSLNHRANAPCLANFNDVKLYKFGGLLKNMTMNNYIEVFDPQAHAWSIIHYDFANQTMSSSFNLMAFASAIQINDNEIYVFGGSENEAISNVTYTLRIDQSSKSHCIEESKLKLPYYGTFWNNFSVIENGKLFCLQNVQLSRSNTYFLGKRKILCYEKEKWADLTLAE